MKQLNRIIIVILALGLTACSGSSDSIAEIFPEIETPQGDTAEEQNVPENIPELPLAATYFGVKVLTLGELNELNVQSKPQLGIYDFEYKPDADTKLFFDKLYTSYVGTCTNSSVMTEWIEVTESGEVVESKVIDYFTYFNAEAGKRYLLRVHYLEASDCDQVFSGITVAAAQ